MQYNQREATNNIQKAASPCSRPHHISHPRFKHALFFSLDLRMRSSRGTLGLLKSKCVPVQMQEKISSIFTSLVQTEHFGRLVATAMTASFERWTPVWRAWRWMHWCWSPYIQSSPWKPKRNVHTMTGQPASESVALLNWSLFLSKKPSEPALFSRKWHNKCLMIQFPTGWLATWL